MNALVFRRAREEDLERLIEIHFSVFPDPRGHEARRRNFVQNPYGELEDLRVVEVGGVPMGHAFLFPLTIAFGGVLVRVGGIASVGVAPEARGASLAARLLDYVHAESNARGDAVTMLHAFRQGFYARHGYAPVSSWRKLRFSPHAVPRAWALDGPGRVRSLHAHDRASIVALYERARARGTGWLSRTERAWTARLLDERRRWFVVEDRGIVTGYVCWRLVQAEPYACTTLVVHELVAADDRAKRRLYGLLGAQRDQVAEVEIEVDASDPIDRALLDMDRGRFGTEKVAHVLGEVVAGPMVRLVDIPRAVEARGYRADGTLAIAVRDADTSFTMTVRAGRATVGPWATAPTLRLDRATLGAILYGALRPSDAFALGWLDVDELTTVGLADRMLELPPYFTFDAI